MFVQQRQRLFAARALFNDHQPLARGHDVLDRLIEVALKTQIAIRYYPHYLTAIHHRQAGYFVLAYQCQHIPHSHLRRNGNRVFYYAALEAFDPCHMSSLSARGHIFMHNADATLLRQCNRQPCFGNRVHRSGHQRDVERNGAGEFGFQANIAGQNVGIAR